MPPPDAVAAQRRMVLVLAAVLAGELMLLASVARSGASVLPLVLAAVGIGWALWVNAVRYHRMRAAPPPRPAAAPRAKPGAPRRRRRPRRH
jgi:hypothetical protein